jgi:hypothetical protein
MTAVVGLVDDGHVIIGADSASIQLDGLEAISRADGKVFRKNHLLIGATGSYRIGQLLKHHASFGTPPLSASAAAFDNWMSTTFMAAIEQTFLNDSWKDQAKGGEFLVACKTYLYRILLDEGQYSRCTGYEAIGSGGAIALGSLYDSRNDSARSPMQRVWSALEAASHHNAGVIPPFRFYSTKYWYEPVSWEIGQSALFHDQYGKQNAAAS